MSQSADLPRVSDDFIPVRPDWLALRSEEVLEPALGFFTFSAMSGQQRRSPATSPWLKIGATIPPRRASRSI